MKKVLYFAAALLLGFTFTACEKEDIENTATVNTAGQWYVTVDAVDENGNVPDGFEDFFGLGRFQILTYNTNANIGSEMFIDDQGEFWEFKFKVNTDQQTRNFSASNIPYNEEMQEYADAIAAGNPILDGDGEVLQGETATITDGKILLQAGRQNNGSPADSIVFYISFSDDPFPARYGYAKYKVSGIRYSGLVEND